MPQRPDNFYPFALIFSACGFHPHTGHLGVPTWLLQSPGSLQEGLRARRKADDVCEQLGSLLKNFARTTIKQFLLNSLIRTVSQATLCTREAGIYELLAKPICHHPPYPDYHKSSVIWVNGRMDAGWSSGSIQQPHSPGV